MLLFVIRTAIYRLENTALAMSGIHDHWDDTHFFRDDIPHNSQLLLRLPDDLPYFRDFMAEFTTTAMFSLLHTEFSRLLACLKFFKLFEWFYGPLFLQQLL